MFGNQYNTPLGQLQGQGQPDEDRRWRSVTNNTPASLPGHSVTLRNNLEGYCISDHGGKCSINLNTGGPTVIVDRVLLERGNSLTSLAGDYVLFRKGMSGLCLSDCNGMCGISLTLQSGGATVIVPRTLLFEYL